MGQINPVLPTAGSTSNAVADPELITALTQILGVLNGGIDGTNLSALLAQAATVNQAGQVVKGVVNIATSESRTNTAYGTLPTPDQITGLVVPANGLVEVFYHATWQESVAGAARAAIFIGANQLQVYQQSVGDGPGTQAAATNSGVAAKNVPLFSIGSGLGSRTPVSGSAADVTTGQAIGSGTESAVVQELAGNVVGPSGNPSSGACIIKGLPAGTYTISVQFKSSSGSVTVSNRLLAMRVKSYS